MLKNVSHLKPAPKSAQQNVHRQRVDDGAIYRLASAVEAMTAVFLRSSSRPRLMSYEEAAEVTTLKRSKLETMVKGGRFREGRHFIREGGRVLFHYNLIDLMFEDKIPLSEEDDSISVPASEIVSPKKTPRQSSQAGPSFNIHYR